jgi:hypothetical protein
MQMINVAGVLNNTVINLGGTGTGGVGTYLVSRAQTVASQAMNASVPMDAAISRDPRIYQLTIDYLDALNTTIGGPTCLHIYTLERGGGQYGLKEFGYQSRTQTAFGLPPAYKLDAALNKIAAFKAL